MRNEPRDLVVLHLERGKLVSDVDEQVRALDSSLKRLLDALVVLPEGVGEIVPRIQPVERLSVDAERKSRRGIRRLVYVRMKHHPRDSVREGAVSVGLEVERSVGVESVAGIRLPRDDGLSVQHRRVLRGEVLDGLDVAHLERIRMRGDLRPELRHRNVAVLVCLQDVYRGQVVPSVDSLGPQLHSVFVAQLCEAPEVVVDDEVRASQAEVVPERLAVLRRADGLPGRTPLR